MDAAQPPLSEGGPVSVRAVRHGQSLANVAFAEAAARGIADAGIQKPDHAVPLSELGAAQSSRVGRRIAADPQGWPELVYVSPFRRAHQTAELLLRELGPAAADIPVRVDDRLGDKRTGELELLTRAAIAARFPEECAKLTAAGPLAYRPPGGESLWDVADRLRSFWDDLQATTGPVRVLIVGHDATVLMLRALTEEMTEAQVLDVIASDPVANATITTWERVNGRLHLVAYNDGTHLGGPNESTDAPDLTPTVTPGVPLDAPAAAGAGSLLGSLVPAATTATDQDDYESAIDAVNRVIGVLAAQIWQREQAGAPVGELDHLQAAQTGYARRRDQLRPEDQQEIDRLRVECSRIVRAFDEGTWPTITA